ncbi:MAG: phosphopantetheine-binding protein [Cyanobacteria bacterium P01_E01_bin.35]
MLDELPLNPNGKVDRQALPAPDTARPELEAAFVAPRTATEQTLAEIFAEVLEVEQVGVHDNFFDLGGHSLLATQLVAQLLKIFAVEITVVDLFEASTVAALAKRIEKMQTLAKISAPVEIDEEREEIEI